MKKKILSLSLPIGLFIELIYIIGNRFFFRFPDILAYPMMFVSIALMLIGIAYHVYCNRQHKNL